MQEGGNRERENWRINKNGGSAKTPCEINIKIISNFPYASLLANSIFIVPRAYKQHNALNSRRNFSSSEYMLRNLKSG